MGRMVDVELLVPTRAIAERLGVAVSTVHYFFRSDPRFPAPVFTVLEPARTYRLWYWPDVETWWDARAARRPKDEPVEPDVAKAKPPARKRAES